MSLICTSERQKDFSLRERGIACLTRGFAPHSSCWLRLQSPFIGSHFAIAMHMSAHVYAYAHPWMVVQRIAKPTRHKWGHRLATTQSLSQMYEDHSTNKLMGVDTNTQWRRQDCSWTDTVQLQDSNIDRTVVLVIHKVYRVCVSSYDLRTISPSA